MDKNNYQLQKIVNSQFPKGDAPSLPNGWEIKKLGEVCEIQKGSSPRPIKEYLTDKEDGENWIKFFYSIRINDQWRIIFNWQNNQSYNVEIIDYHK